jgi:hypothetical protein
MYIAFIHPLANERGANIINLYSNINSYTDKAQVSIPRSARGGEKKQAHLYANQSGRFHLSLGADLLQHF